MKRPKWLSPSLFFLVLGVILVRIASFSPDLIEKYYAQGIYPKIGKILRGLTSWLPFSFGDLLYTVFILLMVRELFLWVRWLRKRELASFLATRSILYLKTVLGFYLLFNLMWGLNYNRISIGKQFDLDPSVSSDSLLIQLTTQLRDKTNELRPSASYRPPNYTLKAAIGYRQLTKSYPFLNPEPISLKASLFGPIGNYLGYSGYYNPFSGEGQVNTSIPSFMIPFVTCHEMGHQLGYAKEFEASFIGHLAAKASGDRNLQYSSYLNMYLSANRELHDVDSTLAKSLWKGLKPEVLQDIKVYRKFLKKYDTPVGIWVDAFL